MENTTESSCLDSGLDAWFRRELKLSGIPDDLAIKLGLRPVHKQYISQCLGFSPSCGAFPVEGFSIPYITADGQSLETPDGNPYCRIRLHWPAQMPDGEDEDGNAKFKPAKYLTPKGAGIQPYILPEVHEWLMDNPDAPLLMTEGERKIIAAFALNLLIVGIPGIWCWGDGNKGLHPLIADYLKDRNEVVMIFDSDARNPKKKPDFDRCAEHLANALIPFNCTLRVWVVPGDGVEKVGLDDWLVAGGTPELARKLIARNAVTVLPRPQVDVNAARLIPVAEAIGQNAARRGVLFRFTPNINSNSGTVVSRPEQTEGIKLLTPATGVTLFEAIAAPYKYTPKGNVNAKFSESTVRQILAAPIFLKQLPPLVSLTNCPVLAMSKGELRVITGYDRETGIWASGTVIEPQSLAEAVSILFSVDAETLFASAGDQSRAMAHIFAPAFAMSGILPCASPILAVEGNDSQSGKGKKSKRTAGIYNSVPVTINQEGESSIGSIEEKLDAALISEAEFISLDNMEQIGRKPFSSPKLCSVLTESMYVARAAYTENVQIDPRRRIIMLTSNGVILSKDILNRLCPVRLIKQNDRQFKEYPEGSQEDHIRANYPAYLGAVFRVIREWHRCGCPQSQISVSTGFERWWKVMDWIVLNIFKLGSVIDGYKEISARVTDPELSWLRSMVNAISIAGKANQPLQISDMLEIMIDAGIDLPGYSDVYQDAMLNDEKRKNLALGIGQRIGRLFRKHGNQDSIVITPWKLVRETEKRSYTAGTQEIKLYTVIQMPTVAGDVPSNGGNLQPASTLPVVSGDVATMPQTVSGLDCIETVTSTVISGSVNSNEINTPSMPQPTVSGKSYSQEKVTHNLFDDM